MRPWSLAAVFSLLVVWVVIQCADGTEASDYARVDRSVAEPVVAAAHADCEPDVLIVGFVEPPTAEGFHKFKKSLASAEVWRGLHHAPKCKGAPHATHPLAHVRIVELAPGTDVEAAAERVRRVPGVAYAHPNYIMHTAFSPDDPFYSSFQYGPQIVRADEAWDITQGDAEVIVAIADSGLYFDHEDLQDGAVWENDDPVDGVDNDNNGFIDDYHGWDFLNNDNEPTATGGHGTHVAGIAAARLNNTRGIAGMGNVTIMPVQVFNFRNGTWLAIAQAIFYAVDNGAQVINYSGGGPGGAGLLAEACQYAWDNDVVVVAAAGNHGTAQPFYPASYPQTLAISGTGPDDVYYESSGKGPHIDVAAPGIDVYSLGIADPFDYGFSTGTSQAAAHVTGLVALMYTVNPDLHVEQVRQLLHQGAVDLGDPGFDEQFGWGRIDAKASIDAAVDAIPVLKFDFPDDLPDHVEPGVDVEISVRITSGSEVLDPDSPAVHYRYFGSIYTVEPLVAIGGDDYLAVLPAAECGQTVQMFFSAASVDETTVTSPLSAPAELHVAPVGVLTIAFEDDFETDTGWVAEFEGGDTTGQWVREDPISNLYQPEDDHSPDGTLCFVTGNCDGGSGACDVDFGPVTLTSPRLDLSIGEGWSIQYARWFFNYSSNDILVVEISDDDGFSWVPLETIGPGSGGGWTVSTFAVTDFVDATDAVRVRFQTADDPNNSITEAAVDDFTVFRLVCDDPFDGDLDGDGDIDLDDLDLLLDCSGGPGVPLPGGCERADGDGDKDADFGDYQIFQANFTGP